MPCILRDALEMCQRIRRSWKKTRRRKFEKNRELQWRRKIYVRSHWAGEEGVRLYSAKSGSWGSDRKRWLYYWSGIPWKIWRTSRGAECVGFLQPVSRRCHDLCNVGTLLSSRKAATMHRCHHRSRYQPGSDWFRGSKSVSGRKRDPDFKGSWNTGNRTCVEGRMRRIKSGIFPLHPDWPPLCDHEIRHDYGWKDRRLYRCFQMGDRGRSQASCTWTAKEKYWDHGGDRYGTGRWSYA